MTVDYIIVGQGIAGSMLAWHLLSAGKTVLIVDEFHLNSASRIASGIINPVTGKRLVKSWKVDELIPFAERTYRHLEKDLGIKIFSRKKICRIFSNKEDFQFFRNKLELDELPRGVNPLKEIPDLFNDATLGGIEISESYQLDYPVLLTALRKLFLDRRILHDEKFDFKSMDFGQGKIYYRGIIASKIIFCEGSALGNPYFKWLPFNLAKGEVITVSMEGFPQDCIWHKGVFILPLENNTFRVGATYEWNFADDCPSEAGKQELAFRLSRAVRIPFDIIQHDAAIRPTVVDRRPMVGLHPKNKELGVFNGLGTKGASLAPFFSHQFAMHLVNGSPLDKEVSIDRFSKEPFFPVVSGKEEAD